MSYNLLWVSDPPNFCTGYSTVTKNILNRLNKLNWDCTAVASTPTGEPIKNVELQDGTRLDFKIIGAYKEQYALDVLPKYISKYQADVCGFLLDTFMVFPRILDLNFQCKTFFYFPSDGGGHMPLGCEEILRKVDLPIAMSKFGQKQLKDIHGINAVYLPHGVNTNLYYPLPVKEEIKAKVPCFMFNGRQMIETPGMLNNKFVVGSVFRNQPRKMADRMYKAFAKFAKDRNDIVLYLHTDPNDNASHFNTFALLQRLNILHKVVFTGMDFTSGVSVEKLKEIYNAMDVFFLSTSGEGFGIPTLEAMSCGIPCIVTDGTTTPELLMENGQCGEPVKLAGTEKIQVSELMFERGWSMQKIDEFLANGTIIGSWNVDRNLMDIDDAVVQLQKLYLNKELREQYGKIGRKKAVIYYDWELLLPVWDKLLKGLVEN